jgi:hypothetical protein
VLFTKDAWAGLADGSITVTFRTWKRRQVTPGGTALTPAGQLAIDDVREVPVSAITDADAVRAGRSDRVHLLAELGVGEDATVWRVDFHLLGEDPRSELRQQVPGSDEVAAIVARLDRMDRRSASGPWTAAVLDLIAAHPGRRAADLAGMLGMPTPDLKVRVRRLKDLGLTESLVAGYRVSPRGEAVHDALPAGRRAPAGGPPNA